VGSEGAEALGAAVDASTRSPAARCACARQPRDHARDARAARGPRPRERLKRPEVTRQAQGLGVAFTFDPSEKGLTAEYFFLNQRTGDRLGRARSLARRGSKNDRADALKRTAGRGGVGGARSGSPACTVDTA
jgi:hypothetical protein